MKLYVALAAAGASLLGGCINWDGEDGASDIFCRHRPSVCDPDSVKRFDGGTTVQSDAGVIPGGGGGGGGSIGGSLDTFDPSQVYLRGGLSEGGSYKAISSLSNPDDPTVGFDITSMGPPSLRSTDGKLLYLRDNTHELHVFTADKLQWNEAYERYDYPADPAANDPELIGRICSLTNTPEGPDFFVTAADTGEVYYRCEGTWRYPNGSVIPAEFSRVWSVAHGGYILASDSFGDTVVLAPDGTLTKVAALDDVFVYILHARSTSSGFQAAVDVDGAAEDRMFEYWHIDPATAVATKVSSYSGGSLLLSPRLAGNGDLYGFDYVGSVDVVLRYPVDGGPVEVAYTEASAPASAPDYGSPPSLFNFVHISDLITGP